MRDFLYFKNTKIGINLNRLVFFRVNDGGIYFSFEDTSLTITDPQDVEWFTKKHLRITEQEWPEVEF